MSQVNITLNYEELVALFSKERNDLMTASPNGSLSKALAATMKSL